MANNQTTFIEIAVSEIAVDMAAQIRVAGTDPAIVADYADAMAQGAAFPPIVLFHDGDSVYFPADGLHRIEASKKIGRATILADVRQGNRRDAILFAVGANADHGFRRSQADKRNAVETLLKDPEWTRLSDRKIGEAARVDHKTVAKIRRELTAGEIPTAKTKQASSPANGSAAGKSPAEAVGQRGSMVERLLRATSDDVLIAEAARRGWEVVR